MKREHSCAPVSLYSKLYFRSVLVMLELLVHLGHLVVGGQMLGPVFVDRFDQG